jgi:hypothetical protein
MAAVLACGPSALLSHGSAAALWDLLPTSSAQIHVTASGGERQGPARVKLHRVRCLHRDDRAVVDGIPVTSVARTLLEIAGSEPRRRFERAMEEAERRRILDAVALTDL